MNTSQQILDQAKLKKVTLVTAESCTGGLIASALTEIAGSSAIFDRGFVTYSNAAKQDMLGVLGATLDVFGAVSEQVAAEMARGAMARSRAGIALSVTGIAGPGGSDHKPEGRVCFGIATHQKTDTQTVDFGALGRSQVRSAAVAHGLDLILQTLVDFPHTK